VYRFLCNPEILEEFHSFVFLKEREKRKITSLDYGSVGKIVLAKGVEIRSNHKLLVNFKNQLNRRIYDIKTNRY
jgi:hypothetical protein